MATLTHWLLCQQQLAVTSTGLCYTSDIITFDQIYIMYALVLQEGRIFPMVPRSAWLGQLSQKCAWKCSKIPIKTQSKIAFNYTWLLCDKNFLYWWCFPGNFWTKTCSRRSTTAPKDKKRKKGKEKNLKNRKALKLLVQKILKILISVSFLSRLELFWLKFRLKCPKCPKIGFLPKSSRCEWVNIDINIPK